MFLLRVFYFFEVLLISHCALTPYPTDYEVLQQNDILQQNISISHIRDLRSKDSLQVDVPLIKSLRPLKDGRNIMFWRPQKVGSSTIVSILTSYAYRYNFLPRRKASSNHFCRRIAQCALDSYKNLNTSSEHNSDITFLARYIKMDVPGSGRNPKIRNVKSSRSAQRVGNEVLSDAIGSKITLSHEICNMPFKYIEPNLNCAFLSTAQKRRMSNGRRQLSSSSTEAVKKPLQLFMVREPLNRIVSVYYFWGELYKLATQRKHDRTQSTDEPLDAANAVMERGSLTGIHVSERKDRMKSKEAMDSSSGIVIVDDKNTWKDKKNKGLESNENSASNVVHETLNSLSGSIQALGGLFSKGGAMLTGSGGKEEGSKNGHRALEVIPQRALTAKLGSVKTVKAGAIRGGLFKYHGEESTVPPANIAMDFARASVYSVGMPGPSYTWSLFSDQLKESVKIVQSDDIMSIVLERLDESLVVTSHYLGVTLADVVVAKYRKALSTHPKITSWPQQVVATLRKKLIDEGEYTMYAEANKKLDERIAGLKANGVNFEQELSTLKALQKRVAEVCFKDETLNVYRDYIKNQGYPVHPSENKLRDVDEIFAENGHIFSFNREIFCSFDLCGSCEAHALLVGIKKKLATSIETSTTLRELVAKNIVGDDVEDSDFDKNTFAKCPKSFV